MYLPIVWTSLVMLGFLAPNLDAEKVEKFYGGREVLEPVQQPASVQAFRVRDPSLTTYQRPPSQVELEKVDGYPVVYGPVVAISACSRGRVHVYCAG